MNADTWRRIAAALGLAAVALGAFGAHGMKGLLAGYGTAVIWEKAVFYHFIHTAMLYAVAGRPGPARLAPCFFIAGILLFSGSLYLLAATNIRWLGAITPLGGVCFLAGWTALLWPFNKKDPSGS